MRKIASVAAVVVFALANPAVLAQQRPEALVEARRLLEATRYTDLMRQQLTQLSGTILRVWSQANPGLESEVRKAMKEIILPKLDAVLPNMMDEIAKIYAEEFTYEELRDVTRFYETPTGKKLIEKMPALMAKFTTLSQAWGEQAARRAMDRNAEELRSRGLKTL